MDNVEQPENSKVPIQLQPHVYRKGQSGNPHGRPKGQSLKEYARNKFLTMTEEEKEDFFNGIPKVEIWKLAEGNPTQEQDIKGILNIDIDPEKRAVIEDAIDSITNY